MAGLDPAIQESTIPVFQQIIPLGIVLLDER
jgi:hypothetical protein